MRKTGEVTGEKSNQQNLQSQQSNVWNRSTHESALTGQLTAGIHDSTQGRRDEEGLRSSECRGGTARDMSNEVTVSSPSLMTLTSGRENKSYNLRNWCMTGDGNTSKDEIIWIGILDFKRKVKFIIGCTYVHPRNSKYVNKSFWNMLKLDVNKLREDYEVEEILLMGDFNARTAEEDIESISLWDEDNEKIRNSKDKVINEEGKKLIRFCEEENFDLLNGK
ncbi:hypothetical protein ANN_10673 [Periplaneta americana]|uniref:Endonuclease/exonuclease/phosphatase domain-containing protein n=1 Tax=Periplaneta americana TaxID=6978 RepID=A0ABQ8T4M6_PERAM|nr:hypothetical protein ANN_10673 [Periplaneta americana]